MDENLSKTALKELAKAFKVLQLETSYKAKRNAAWLKKTLAWCDEHAITLGREGDSKHFYIERAGIRKVDAKLQSLGYSSLREFQQGASGDRLDAAKVSPNEKDAKELPTEHLVLAVCSDLSMRIAYQSLFQFAEPPAQIQLELDIRTLDLAPYDYLVVVENRDCFSAWHRYQIPSELTNALVVYRGHESHHSKACQALKSRWLEHNGGKGQVYFGDFDPHGLAIAIEATTPYQHLLLPQLSWLKHNYQPLHFDEDKAYSKRDMVHRCPEPWRVLLDTMYQESVALRQQWMFDTQLRMF
ncbi:MAG: DUF7281 domain-containing protein [Psychrobium sp.]